MLTGCQRRLATLFKIRITFLSLLCAAVLFSFETNRLTFLLPQVAPWIILLGVFFLGIRAYLGSALLERMQQASSDLTPRVIELYGEHRACSSAGWLLAALPPLFLLSGLTMFAWPWPEFAPFLLGSTLILLGLGIDAINAQLECARVFSTPRSFLKLLQERAEQTVVREKEAIVLEELDSLTEIAFKAVSRATSSLAIEAIDSMRTVMRSYEALARAKKGMAADPQFMPYALSYLLHRYERIFEEANRYLLEPVSTYLLSATSKVAFEAASTDFSLALPPVKLVGKWALQEIEAKRPEVAIKAACVLQELGKLILEESDRSVQGFKILFIGLTQELERITKALFAQDKSISIALLISFFRELELALKKGRFKDHADCALVLDEVSRVMEQFAALSQVMEKVPPEKQG